jgi:hypothetical protein
MVSETTRLCPYCGGVMELYRRDRQETGVGCAILAWLICAGCTHVTLGEWSLTPRPDTARR